MVKILELENNIPDLAGVYLPPITPGSGKGTQFAFALDGAMKGVYICLNYYNSFNSVPDINVQILNLDTVSIQSNFYERQVLGGGFSTAMLPVSCQCLFVQLSYLFQHFLLNFF